MLKNHKILLTGLTGRIGAAMAVRFAPDNEVWGLARYSRETSLGAARALGVIPVKGDFARGSLAEVPTDFDYVLHVAADVNPSNAESGMIDNADGAARLMSHCRNAKAFLHVSTTGVYKQHPDPHHVYPESSDLGGAYNSQYTATKLGGEGAIRAACLILGVPTVICRQNVQYGGPNGGLIDHFLDVFIETGDAYLPPEGPMISGPIHEDDICDLVAPSLAVAAVPAEIVNWGGDEPVDWQELFEYAGELTGKAPRFIRSPDFTYPNCFPDPAKRQSIAGPCKISWREGVRRSVNMRLPELKLPEVVA